jgi:hypothetical protein
MNTYFGGITARARARGRSAILSPRVPVRPMAAPNDLTGDRSLKNSGQSGRRTQHGKQRGSVGQSEAMIFVREARALATTSSKPRI